MPASPGSTEKVNEMTYLQYQRLNKMVLHAWDQYLNDAQNRIFWAALYKFLAQEREFYLEY
jgi:hypothetical protein